MAATLIMDKDGGGGGDENDGEQDVLFPRQNKCPEVT